MKHMPSESPQHFPLLAIPADPEKRVGLAISTFVERVQEHLAIFSIPDAAVGNYLQRNSDTALYDPKSLIFEFLVNDRSANRAVPSRKFELHVSERSLKTAYQTDKKVLADLSRLYINAKTSGVDWQQVQWDAHPLVVDRGLTGLADEMRNLDEIYHRSQAGTLSDTDLDAASKTLQKLVHRWEIESIPTNFAASALIYEAWKLGKFLPLTHFNFDDPEHQRLLDGLFIARSRERSTVLLERMPVDLDVTVRELEQDPLINGQPWTRKLFPDSYPENGRKWFSCVEFSLLHRALIQQPRPTDRYLVHYPLIIDDYWFAGLAYVYAEWDELGQLPELFDRGKYLKMYKVSQAIADALKVSRKREALLRAAMLVKEGKSDDEIFRNALQDYFVCLHVLDPSDDPSNYNIRSRSQVVYNRHNAKIYGPPWMTDFHKDRIVDEIDGQREIFGISLPGLYDDVQAVCQSLRAIQMESKKEGKKQGQDEGRDERSRQIAHQAAGLIAEVWCDPASNQLQPQARGCLWQLKTLIAVWGNFDLQPNESITDGADPYFPEWIEKSDQEIVQELIKISLSHALRRSTYRRPQASALDDKVRRKALQILGSPNPVEVFQGTLGIALENSILPNWIRWRGFALCFHHCFWQAAYHAFRAACMQDNHISPESCLKIEISNIQVRITNRVIPQSGNFPSPRDKEFYQLLQERLNPFFRIHGPQIMTQDQVDVSQVIILPGG